MRSFLRLRRHKPLLDPELPPVSQPAPLSAPSRPPAGLGMIVLELSELEARALCAREDIPVFWPRRNIDKPDGP